MGTSHQIYFLKYLYLFASFFACVDGQGPAVDQNPYLPVAYGAGSSPRGSLDRHSDGAGFFCFVGFSFTGGTENVLNYE